MYYLKHGGENLEITHENVFNVCPKCGRECAVNLAEVVTEDGLDLCETAVYCPECNAEILGYYKQMEAAAEEINQLSARYGVEVEKIVLSGLQRGLTIKACLVGARLALGDEYFTPEDVAAVIGGTVEEAEALMGQEGVQPVKVSTLPGFEWLLQQ